MRPSSVWNMGPLAPKCGDPGDWKLGDNPRHSASPVCTAAFQMDNYWSGGSMSPSCRLLQGSWDSTGWIPRAGYIPSGYLAMLRCCWQLTLVTTVVIALLLLLTRCYAEALGKLQGEWWASMEVSDPSWPATMDIGWGHWLGRCCVILKICLNNPLSLIYIYIYLYRATSIFLFRGVFEASHAKDWQRDILKWSGNLHRILAQATVILKVAPWSLISHP